MPNKSKILVVDDAALWLTALSHVLAADGHEVRLAVGGEQALAAVAGGVPDLVLLAVQMPGLDGFEVFRRLKARDDCRDLPVMMISETLATEERAEGIELGAADFITKPLDQRELLARVRQQLELSRLRAEHHRHVTALELANHQLQHEIERRQRVEEALQTRLIALTRPLDSAEETAFSDLFDLADLQELQDQFSTATGVASIITTPDGTPLTRPSNFCRLCREVIRQTEIGSRNCHHSDAALGAPCTTGPIIKPCLSGGLWDAGASITVGGKHIANWLIGQVRNEAQDAEQLLAYADEIGADREVFRQALAEVPVMSQERFEQTAQALFTFARELSNRAYQNVQQARFITELQQAKQALRDSEQNYRLLFDGMLEGFALHEILCDETGQPVDYRFLTINPAFERLTGLRAAEVIGRTVREVMPAIEPFWIERYGRVALTGEPVHFEEHHAGLNRDFHVTAYRSRPGQFAALFEDITARKAAAARVARLSQLYAALSQCNQAIVRSATVAELLPRICQDVVKFGGMSMAWIGMLDETGGEIRPVASAGSGIEFLADIVISTNAAAPFGSGPAGTAIRENKPIWCQDYQLIPNTAPWRERVATYGWASCAALPLRRQGRTIGVLGVFNVQPNAFDEEVRDLLEEMADDISFALDGFQREDERRAAEANLVAATARAEQLAIKAEASSRTKSEFLAIMSHELRTPLNGVLGFAELLSYSILDAEQRFYTKTITSSGQHLLAVVNDILDFSSIEKGTLTIQEAPFALAGLLDSAGIGTHQAAVAKGLEYHCEIAPGVPTHLTGDERRIRQILINLLNNAVKFTTSGVVILCLAPAAEGDQHFLDFSVEDTGIGIAATTVEQLFQPFVQADSSIHREFGGTGLGLAISKRIAEAMGGSLTVASTPGTGSRFTFRLPVASPAPDTAASPSAAPVPPPLNPLVLVADDDLISCKLAGIMLQSLGCRAEFAANGIEAVKAFEPGKFSAILMDVAMPLLDGLAATKQIRELEAATGGWVRIIAVTANVMPGDRERLLARGMDEFIAKPFKREELAAKLGPVASAPLKQL